MRATCCSQRYLSPHTHTHTLASTHKRALIVYRLVSALGVAPVCMCVGCEQLAKRTGGECVASVAARLAKVSRNLGTPTHQEEPRVAHHVPQSYGY